MAAILAIFNRDGRPADSTTAEAMLTPSRFHSRDGEDVLTAADIALAHQHWWVTPEEQGERQPLTDASGCYSVTCDARLDNRRELLDALGIGAHEGQSLSDAALILRAYARWGTECAAHLLGDFALIVWDAVERQLFLARDAMGGRGLCYYADAHVFLAATECAQILAHPAVTPSVNEGKIAHYLTESHDDGHETYIKPVYWLPPAHCMLVCTEDIRMWRFWDVDAEARIRYKTDQEYADHFADLLTEAVRCRLRATGTVGLSMSGGLDSTSIAAVATSLRKESPAIQPRLKTFSYVFDELRSCDEREFIFPVVERLGLDANYICCDDRWTLRDLPDWPLERDFVVSDAYIWLPIAVMRAARAAGCQVLLTGHFGDALFWDADYWIAAMLRDGRLGEAVRTLVTSHSVNVWRQTLAGPGMRSLIPRGVRKAYRRSRPRPPAVWQEMVHRDLIVRTQTRPRRAAVALERDFPAPGQRQHHETLTGSALLEGRPVARRFYCRHGLEYAEPFCDRRLASFAMAIPADQWGRPGRSKCLLRNAMAGRLPEAVVERRSRTGFEALWDRGLRERERASVEMLLKDPLIVRRGYVRAEWLRDELHTGRPWADGGYPLWLCISLELWLRRFW
jgi:asparagine synthase (glutamine-hydrolysing)